MAGSATRVPCEPAHERNQVSSLGHREPGDNVLLAAKASDVALMSRSNWLVATVGVSCAGPELRRSLSGRWCRGSGCAVEMPERR